MDFNTAFTLASMHGFWRGGYDYAKDHIPFWPINEWTLPGSTKLHFPVNVWEHKGGNEIRRENTMIFGYIISLGTLIGLICASSR